MDKYLADTHVLLWMAELPENIPTRPKAILESGNVILLSHVSVWEIAIKAKTQKLELQFDLSDYIDFSISRYGFQLFPITLQHINYTQQLTLHHRDTFDRLLIAQSFVENIPVISSDEVFDLYGVQRIWKKTIAIEL